MTVWDINGGADSTITNGLPTAADNDLGTIRGGGNIADTDRFQADAVNLGQSTYVTVPSGLGNIDSPLSAGAFNAGDQVIVKTTTDLAGVSNNALLYGASNSAANSTIHQKATISTYFYKTAVRTGGWHEYSGVFDPAVTVSNTGGWDQTTDADQAADLKANNTDNAANPSAAVPGELVYRDGSPTPVQDEYKAKTVF
jgi:hypothetical protein